MTKIDKMDESVCAMSGKINSSEIFKIVRSIFSIDLNLIPISSLQNALENAPAAILDSHLEQYKEKITGPKIREMINHIFGVNLDAISSLAVAIISLFSKGLWMLRDDHDLFVVHTGEGDVSVKILPTGYFTEQTGLDTLPHDLQQSLTNLGFNYDEKCRSYYFSTPDGEAVIDAFKGQTMGVIIQVIQNSYSHI
jgi:hypothetical protein